MMKLTMRSLLPLALLLMACATTAPQPPSSPSWEKIPPWVANALCSRLQMDAIGTGGGLSIVRSTQPFVTPAAVAGLAASTRKRIGPGQALQAVIEGNRTMPIELSSSSCGWIPVDPDPLSRRRDEMTVELSAPLANPLKPGEAGIFARAVLGSQEEWFWIALASRGEMWGVRSVNAFAQ